MIENHTTRVIIYRYLFALIVLAALSFLQYQNLHMEINQSHIGVELADFIEHQRYLLQDSASLAQNLAVERDTDNRNYLRGKLRQVVEALETIDQSGETHSGAVTFFQWLENPLSYKHKMADYLYAQRQLLNASEQVSSGVTPNRLLLSVKKDALLDDLDQSTIAVREWELRQIGRLDRINASIFVMMLLTLLLLGLLVFRPMAKKVHNYTGALLLARRELEQRSALLDIIHKAQTHFITHQHPASLFETMLSDLITYTESGFGLIGELKKDDKGQVYLKCFHQGVSPENHQPETRGCLEMLPSDALCQAVINSGEAFLSNNPKTDLGEFAPPFGDFPEMNNVLALPMYKGSKLVGVVILSNRPAGYTDDMIEALKPALSAAAHIMEGQRNKLLRVEMEQQLRENARGLEVYAAKLRQSNNELEQFACVASHDLQEPLRKIQMLGNLLSRRARQQLDTDCRDYLDRMQRSINRMQDLISDLLLLSRITSRESIHKRVSLTGVMTDLLCDLETRIKETNATILCEDLHVLWADPVQIHQLLQNLVSNALKFSQPGLAPVIRITTEKIDNQFCRLMVEDNGIGFDEKHADRIFQIFERLHGQNGGFEGTGIGLAVCRKIVERHGGSITVKSQPGQGSTFTVTLPLAEAEPEHWQTPELLHQYEYALTS